MPIKMKQGNAGLNGVCVLCTKMSSVKSILMDIRFAKESANKIQSLEPPAGREGAFGYG